MSDLFSVALVTLLFAISGIRVWTARSRRLLSVEQKALVLDTSSKSNVWLPACLAVCAAVLSWLPGSSIPPYYRPGVLSSYIVVPFLLSVAASTSTLIRLSRLSLPSFYRWRFLLGAIAFHLALAFLIYAAIHDAFTYGHRRGHETSNNAMELTTSHRTTLFSVPTSFSPFGRRVSARGSSSCSRC